MTNNQFLDYYQHLQYQIMYQKLIDLKFASVGFCKTYDSPVFNFALVSNPINYQEINVIERELKDLNRNSSIYFENSDKFIKFSNHLSEIGYKKEWEDSWMFHDGSDIDNSKFDLVKKVTNDEELEIYLKTFNECYQKDDPQNPYGELGNYIDVARNSWKILKKSDKIEYFIVYDNDVPVAVSTLTNFAGIGYISNVGSLRSVRGKGYGKLATLFCVEKSKQNENTQHCLATEEGSYPNEFYKRIGFKTRFTAVGFVKN